jgi:Fe/S biogenesis protein NfuA
MEHTAISSLTVTEAAQQHFRKLLKNEEVPGLNIRIFVSKPGTPHADIGVTFCPPNEEEESDERFDFDDFQLFVEDVSMKALERAIIDYEDDQTNPNGGQLAISAPNLKGKKPANDSPLTERVNYVLDSEINPGLAGHGGRVTLVEILEGGIVILRFGGGCHGCGMANVTLKQGIEKTLLEKFPGEITEVRDITDHATGTNPYY